MTRMIMVAAVAALLALAACAGVKAPLVRGVGSEAGGAAEGVLSSNAHPAMAVLPAAGFEPVAHGVTDVGVPLNSSLTATASARVWYALHADKTGARQLVASLAEVGNSLEWSLNPGMIDRQGLPMLNEGAASRAGAALTFYTYVRPAAKDPWMRPFADHGKGWEGGVLLRQYTWWSMANQVKVVVEYREPVPAGADLSYDPTALRAFEERADAAFTLLRKERGDLLPSDVTRSRRDEARVSPRLLAGTLGEAVGGVRLLMNEGL